jgi:hypothetical protein
VGAHPATGSNQGPDADHVGADPGFPALLAINLATDGTVAAVEQARTVLDTAYPGYDPPATLSEQRADSIHLDLAYQQLADVVVLTSLAIAGCTLAASVAGGLAERKRPFSLLRLAGTPPGLLQRVVALESAVPLLVTAVLAIGVGFAAAAMYAAAQVGPFTAPRAAGACGASTGSMRWRTRCGIASVCRPSRTRPPQALMGWETT